MSTPVADQVAELRADIREWRRGRATATLTDVLQDVYIAVFGAGMLGAMLGNVVLGLRREADAGCASAACVGGRLLLPWVLVVATLAAVLAAARLLGPVFTSPAAGSWLLSAPVDRAALLRRRLVVAGALAALACLLVTVASTTLAGLRPWSVVAASTAVVLAGVTCVALATVSQASGGPGARRLHLVVLALAEGGLLALALGRAPRREPDVPAYAVALAVAAVAALAVPSVVAAGRSLRRMRRRRLEPGGQLSSGLSGALATLDLALAYDVVVAHTARARGSVRSRRGGPTGPLALVWRDLVRLRRRPASSVTLAAAAVAPYAVARADGGRLVLLVAVLAGFLAVAPLCLALRVVLRTPSLSRMLPSSDRLTRTCTLVVPAGAATAFGLAVAPAAAWALDVDAAAATGLGLAVALGSLASAGWWMASRPVDYAAPAVSTPMGAVPPGMVAGALHGPDMVLLTSAPLLVAPTVSGAAVSALVSLAVLAYVVGRR